MSERQRGAADIPSPCNRSRRFQIIETQTKQESEQGVPDYDPQAAAMHTLPLAAHLSSTARGSSLNPDVVCLDQ